MQKLTPILPCRSRDDASEPRSPAQAEELLATWTALWHPALVAAAGAMPKWSAAASPPDDPAGHLLLIPPTAEPLLPENWLDHAEKLGAKMIRGRHSRPEMMAAALTTLETPPAVDADLVADFLALGFCHWVIDTITVTIRYTNSLDEHGFERELIAAAVAACDGRANDARARLQAAFDLLHTAREYYYSSQAHLLDLTLVARSTIGAALREQLRGRTADDAPCNLLLSASVLEQMAAREPTTLEALRHALQRGVASIAGGEYRELELPLLPLEAIRGQLVKGRASYERHLGVHPTVFARRRFGMTPLLPQILDTLGFRGVIHATLDDGQFPTAAASRQRWDGLDGTTVEALLRVPIDAAQSSGFVRLPHAISGAADMDNQPTATFAHWPGCTSCWYEDVERTRRYTSVLGMFRLLPDYFEQTGMSGHQISFKPDQYRSPYLDQAVAAGEPDPISRWQRYAARRADAEAAGTMAALTAVVSGKPSEGKDDLLEKIDAALAVPGAEAANIEHNIDEQLFAAGKIRAEELLRAMGGQVSLTPGRTSPAGLVVINPSSFSRKAPIDVSELAALPDVAGPVLQAAVQSGRKWAVVDVPPLGFAVVRAGAEQAAAAPPRRGIGFFRKAPPTPPPMAEQDAKQGGAVLRNEFFEVVIDPRTGAIRAIYDFHSRGPRLAQQLAMRLHAGENDDAYSKMAADEIRVIEAGPIVGEVLVRGRLVDAEGQLLADFRQTTRVAWGSRVIEIAIEIDPHRVLGSDAWNSYYAARFAWALDMPEVYRGVNQATVASEIARFEAPQFVEIRGPATARTTILTAGLPYHRRCGMRKLDSLLIVRWETARRFRLGIGVDLPRPQPAALDFAAPARIVSATKLPANALAWLFHFDIRDVVATHWEPIVESGAVCGTRMRLLETEGRHVSLGLRSFRAVRSAQKLGGGDYAAIDLSVAGDLVTVPLRPYEWAEVEVR